ncbi:hypothetical protein GcC1_019045 [Golovinomyces cichoracearum]|uniref:Uncharacterized protein n=1 Tax=Golovinomyces cichoracearum TaxID=62708 RepID=A0A420J599_9PEZI|nr:hypothetical protein GcC1_019045 [Golovinomyces cichoracearum]
MTQTGRILGQHEQQKPILCHYSVYVEPCHDRPKFRECWVTGHTAARYYNTVHRISQLQWQAQQNQAEFRIFSMSQAAVTPAIDVG